MASPADGVAGLLAAANVGVLPVAADDTTDWVIRIGKMTNAPDMQIITYDSGGTPPHPTLLIDYPHFMVQVRSSKGGYADAYQKAKDVKDVLLGMTPRTVNGDRWDGVIGMGDIAPIGRDDADRQLFSVNFRIILEPAASGLSGRDPL